MCDVVPSSCRRVSTSTTRHLSNHNTAHAVHAFSHHGGLDAVEPGALVVLPWGREGRARELLRVQPCRERREKQSRMDGRTE